MCRDFEEVDVRQRFSASHLDLVVAGFERHVGGEILERDRAAVEREDYLPALAEGMELKRILAALRAPDAPPDERSALSADLGRHNAARRLRDLLVVGRSGLNRVLELLISLHPRRLAFVDAALEALFGSETVDARSMPGNDGFERPLHRREILLLVEVAHRDLARELDVLEVDAHLPVRVLGVEKRYSASRALIRLDVLHEHVRLAVSLGHIRLKAERILVERDELAVF